jgi:peroxiredoxin
MELGELRSVQERLASRGGRIAAVSVDAPDLSRSVHDKLDLPFPILADVDRATLRAYGLVHQGAGPGGCDVAVPAQLLVNPDGKILWRRTARLIQDRPSPDAVWASIEPLLPSG